MDQKIAIKFNGNEKLIINGMPGVKKAAKFMPNVSILETLNISLDFFNN
jgi:hypothetical protein